MVSHTFRLRGRPHGTLEVGEVTGSHLAVVVHKQVYLRLNKMVDWVRGGSMVGLTDRWRIT